MIKILDNLTISQIAAGEVIERPVNIVKELVENAIDANATRITIEIENGGIDKIVIKDNGDGFDKVDIPLAFVPHATSKLTKIEDLNDIYTYGFRGEALSSISLVSKVTLITKQRDSLKSYQIISDNGKISDISETSGTDGTKIIVEDLFKNIPARKKFLKSASIEAAKIYDIVEKISLSRKDISFKFVSDNRERFSTPGNNKISNIIYTLYGKEVSDNLIDIDTIVNDVHITGVVAKPIISKNNRNEEIFFINGRYVKNDILYKALEEAYKEYMMQHKYPFVILNIELDGTLIDVNVHPQKIEIRFSNKLDIFTILKTAVAEVLRNNVLINNQSVGAESVNVGANACGALVGAKFTSPQVGADIIRPSSGEVHDPVSININDLKSLYEIDNEDQISFDKNINPVDSNDDEISLFANLSKTKTTQKSLYEYFNDIDQTVDVGANSHVGAKFTSPTVGSDNICPKPNTNKQYTYLGQLFNTYLIFELKDKVVFVDQHAAHEKINYEKFMDMINKDSIKTQKIMPMVINLNAIQYNCIKENIDEFRSIGYDIEFFGDKDIIVEGVPLFLLEIADKQFIVEMIDSFSNDNDLSNYDSIKDKIATISCKASIKANQKINETEAYNLIEQLFSLKNPYNCPHGRPTMIEFTKVDFDKRFKRIVT